MIAILSYHLLESTLLCAFLSVFACVFCRRAADRYAVLLVAIAKFAIPSALLAPAGARLANLWPARNWMASLAMRFDEAFWMLLGSPLSRLDHLSPMATWFIFAVWALGAVLTLSFWMIQLNRRRLVFELPTADQQAMLEGAFTLFGARVAIRLRSSDGRTGPALSGIWKPVLAIPHSLWEQLSVSECNAVLIHELAHARRLDNLAAISVHALVCSFWFHPLLWYLERRLSIEREHACDETVTRAGVPARAYVSAILKVCKFQLGHSPAGVNQIGANDLERRLELILDRRPSAAPSYLAPVLSAMLVVGIAFVPIAEGYCKQCVSTGREAPTHVIKGDVR